MTPVTPPFVEGWPVAVTLAVVLAGERVRAGRRRSALNAALHELRRPLQILALSDVAGRAPYVRGGASALELTWVALADLDHQINGGIGPFRPRLVRCRDLVESAAARWDGTAGLASGGVTIRMGRAPVLLLADTSRLGQALDNLIANALEHGGPRVKIEMSLVAQRVRIAVSGSGSRDAMTAAGRVEVGTLVSRLGGRQRRGHGLRVVAATAAIHGGRLLIAGSANNIDAVLELPLAGAGAAIAA